MSVLDTRFRRLEAARGGQATLPSVILQQIRSREGNKPADAELEAQKVEAVRSGRARDRDDVDVVVIQIVYPKGPKPCQ